MGTFTGWNSTGMAALATTASTSGPESITMYGLWAVAMPGDCTTPMQTLLATPQMFQAPAV
eukprot:CAMPEP_0197859732 /NCGR_PEP_ID=MMETSP1438-20131217/34565_1 /TAXON_ID=1461541 /ORGANISM="Pterosperma sp., Strain CCMP1384" /LENGTH=60 /DNA_ID=CAMNT_0043476349 /DNA_START=98 /DNA_END=281 /DNA_ORIENTATION=-